ncbi:hypothetical protein ACWEQO_27565 [Streptomyces sp. NPDC004051]
MYVWSDHVRWNQQVETRAVLAAGEACRALVTRQQSTGGARPSIHWPRSGSVSQGGKSQKRFVSILVEVGDISG